MRGRAVPRLRRLTHATFPRMRESSWCHDRSQDLWISGEPSRPRDTVLWSSCLKKPKNNANQSHVWTHGVHTHRAEPKRGTKTFPCAFNMWARCQYTQGRFERTHGDVLNGFFQRVTPHTTPHTHHYSTAHHNPHTHTLTPKTVKDVLCVWLCGFDFSCFFLFSKLPDTRIILGMNRAQRCDGHKRHQSEGGLRRIIMCTTRGHFDTSARHASKTRPSLPCFRSDAWLR